jgi:hypothetical protein
MISHIMYQGGRLAAQLTFSDASSTSSPLQITLAGGSKITPFKFTPATASRFVRVDGIEVEGDGIVVFSFKSECGDIVIEDGSISETTVLGAGARMINCDDGFTLSGSHINELQCTASGEYDKEPGFCEPIGCLAPEVANGFAEVADASLPKNPLGSYATIGCNEGFTLKGAWNVSCHRTLLWADDGWTGDPIKNPGMCVVQAPAVPIGGEFTTKSDASDNTLVSLCTDATCNAIVGVKDGKIDEAGVPVTEDKLIAALARKMQEELRDSCPSCTVEVPEGKRRRMQVAGALSLQFDAVAEDMTAGAALLTALDATPPALPGGTITLPEIIGQTLLLAQCSWEFGVCLEDASCRLQYQQYLAAYNNDTAFDISDPVLAAIAQDPTFAPPLSSKFIELFQCGYEAAISAVPSLILPGSLDSCGHFSAHKTAAGSPEPEQLLGMFGAFVPSTANLACLSNLNQLSTCVNTYCSLECLDQIDVLEQSVTGGTCPALASYWPTATTYVDGQPIRTPAFAKRIRDDCEAIGASNLVVQPLEASCSETPLLYTDLVCGTVYDTLATSSKELFCLVVSLAGTPWDCSCTCPSIGRPVKMRRTSSALPGNMELFELESIDEAAWQADVEVTWTQEEVWEHEELVSTTEEKKLVLTVLQSPYVCKWEASLGAYCQGNLLVDASFGSLCTQTVGSHVWRTAEPASFGAYTNLNNNNPPSWTLDWAGFEERDGATRYMAGDGTLGWLDHDGSIIDNAVASDFLCDESIHVDNALMIQGRTAPNSGNAGLPTFSMAIRVWNSGRLILRNVRYAVAPEPGARREPTTAGNGWAKAGIVIDASAKRALVILQVLIAMLCCRFKLSNLLFVSFNSSTSVSNRFTLAAALPDHRC